MKLPEILGKNKGFKIFQEIDLVNHSTIKLHATGNLLLIESVDALKYVLPILNKHDIQYQALGLGANQVLCGHDDRVFIKLKLPFDRNLLSKKRDIYHLPASLSLSLLIKHAQKFDLKGWECMAGIPATIGGATYMNAGTHCGEFGNLVSKVFLIRGDGIEKVVKIDKESYSYRKNHFVEQGEIIYAVSLVHYGNDKGVAARIDNHLAERDKSQPWREKTCGCVLKNISKSCRAGHYIDILNVKGLSYRGIRIDHRHGNFFINEGEAEAENFIELVSIVQDELYLQFGKRFETEVEIVK